MKTISIKKASLGLAGCLALSLVGCNKPNAEAPPLQTMETEGTQHQIDNYNLSGTAEQKAKVDLAFAQLDSEIKELEVRVNNTTGDDKALAQTRLEDLKKRRADLQMNYDEAKFNTLVEDVKNALR